MSDLLTDDAWRPILFALFIAGIEKEILQGCEIGIFADDIIIWSSGRNIDAIESELNNSLKGIQRFAGLHKLNFNPKKSVVSFFTTNKRLYNYLPKIVLDGHVLKYEKYPKYLGFTLDPEITCNRHIANQVERARKRLNILKYISGRDWGADANTLRTTYTSFIRPMLEYGFQILLTASVGNLKMLERIQLSAARIITGLRNSCPNEIVLYEANLQPLFMRWTSSTAKYYSKLYSYGDQHRTSTYFMNWTDVQRLKRDSPFCRAGKLNLLFPDIEHCSIEPNIDPLKDLPRVFFHEELLASSSKKNQHPALLRQLALETIHNTPNEAVHIFTDGSKFDNGNTASGVVIKNQDDVTKIKRRNPNHCSVFRSELIDINAALEHMISIESTENIWIFTDINSSVQYLSYWQSISDRIGLNIIDNLMTYSYHNDIHLQWIPSHVNLHFNDLAKELAKEGSNDPIDSSGLLTYNEIYAKVKADNNRTWRIPPSREWYQQNNPGAALELKGDRKLQTAITRLITGHTRGLTFVQGQKTFPSWSHGLGLALFWAKSRGESETEKRKGW
ncbi:uncharacterized protein [Parasteatoda tepidariorum]|uniref:uncharacterized protein n=1 Tax=Parasteatoda tepidariorum TaxID=114398 RepID=UPI0039BC7FA0